MENFMWLFCVPVTVSCTLLRVNRPIVDIPGKGRVIGVEERVGDFTYNAFRGIPFAQPPIGKLRFKDPVESSGWEGDLDGAKLPRKCVQRFLFVGGKEDCLYLSIYTPKDPLPVMVFIHGGFLYFGSMRSSDQCHALVEKDVIIVGLQYRLSVLGFLSTEDDEAPGNLGLKDQTMALKWVKENIAAFGGDPDRITLFGESAGSYSTSYQMLIPAAKGLFRAAIMQSGTALSPVAKGWNFLEVAQEIGRKFKCPEVPSSDLVSCLQQKSAKDLIRMDDDFYEWHKHPRKFGPRFDGSYIPDEPVQLLKERRFTHVPIMIGTTKDEGVFYCIEWFAYRWILKSLLGDFAKNGPVSMELMPDEKPFDTAYKIYDHYLPGINFNKKQANNATKMNGHRFFQIPTDWMVETVASHVPVYMYELMHRGQHGYTDYFFSLHLSLPQAANWVSHGDDLQYLFDSVLSELETAEDLAVREVFTTTWTNFAKTLNPTPDDSLGFKWKRTDNTDLRHLAIYPKPFMQDDRRKFDRQFWNTLPLRENPHRN